MHKAYAAIEDMYYNPIRPHKTPRLKYPKVGSLGKGRIPLIRL